MNTAILRKCIEELRKPRFSKEYVLGMLEALASMPEAPARGFSEPTATDKPIFTAPGAVADPAPMGAKVQVDPAGDMETPEERAARVGTRKIPPAFLGNVERLSMDPAKTDGKTDVTPFN